MKLCLHVTARSLATYRQSCAANLQKRNRFKNVKYKVKREERYFWTLQLELIRVWDVYTILIMSHCWIHLRVSLNHLKRQMWTAFWVPWVSAVATKSKVTLTRPLWARSLPSMKWGSRCTCFWTTPLVWPLPSQHREITSTITTTLTVRTTPATVALTWMELPAHLGLWTTPMELYSAAPPLGRKCTSVASPNQWVPCFDPIDDCEMDANICWYKSSYKYS